MLVTDEGPVLTQVDAICDYLEALQPEPALLGRTPIEKAEVREWSHRVYCEGLLPIADVLRNGNPAFANRALPGPLEVAQISALVERGHKRLDAFFAALEQRLQHRDHLAGDCFSKADIDTFAICEFAGWIRRAIPPQCHSTARWRQDVAARPAIRRIDAPRPNAG